MSSAEARERLDEIAKANIVWIWRASISPDMGALVTTARKAGARILFDIDDLMFRPEFAVKDLVDGIRTQKMSESGVQKFYQSIQRMLVKADRCTAPTIPLASEIRRLHRTASVIPNGFTARSLADSRAAMRARKSEPDDGLVRIGYASGTLTHQKDFAVAAASIAAILREHSFARLVVFRGGTDVSEFRELDEVSRQIEWRERVTVAELPGEYARFDINIAPLEAGNRYCESKSELKFFEAALAGVPTIASPTRPFADAIRHGYSGLLAANEEEWYAGLKRLICDTELRRLLANQAYHDVLWLYGPERRSLLVAQLVNELLSPVPQRFDLFRSQMHIESPATIPAVALPEYDVVFQSRRNGNSRISVVIPLFNYGHFLVDALESVRQQTMRDLDVIVVDDRSTDNSLSVAHRWLEDHAAEFNMVALLQNRRNSGLGRSRNAAVSFADTELYLALDPDNALTPDCLEQCMASLDDTGAAFAYPTIELFGERTGKIGTTEYDPALFQCANYIDSMAIVRKACWIAVGGYGALDPMGWEDYDFWCKLAEKGLFGVRVQDATARYRIHSASMLETITEQPDMKPRVVADLNMRHPWLELPIPEPGRGRTGSKAAAKGTVRSGGRAIHEGGVDRLLPILRCPETKERLVLKDGLTLASERTGRCWPIVNGRPVFTAEGRNVKIQSETHLSNSLPPRAEQLIQDASGLALNLSAGATTKRFRNLIELEYKLFKHTDVAGDVHRLPFQDEVFDAIVCLNALEHYREPELALEEMRRVLKPGGQVLIHTAFLQPLHEEPHHYYNCTEFGLRHWMRNFRVECLRVSENFNPLYALSWLASDVEHHLRAGVSDEAAMQFGKSTLLELLEFWRNAQSRNSSELWKSFERLPPEVQHRLAAGWEAIGRKV